jgi:ABC-type microcin C transport system permease subunit YejE
MQKRNLVRMREKKKKKRKTYFSFFLFFFSFSFQFCLNCKVVDTPFVEFKYLANQYMFLYIGSKTFKFSKEQSNTKSSNVKEEKKKKKKTNTQANN